MRNMDLAADHVRRAEIRLLALDERGRRVLAIGADGSSKVVTAAGLQKPVDISADRTGQFAVLDGRSQEVLLYGPDGGILDRVWRNSGNVLPTRARIDW